MCAPPPPSQTISGGAKVILALLRSRLGIYLSVDQACALWREVRSVLESQGQQESIDQAESVAAGRLSVLHLLDVMDGVAHILARENWPVTTSPVDAKLVAFKDLAKRSAIARGYSVIAPEFD